MESKNYNICDKVLVRRDDGRADVGVIESMTVTVKCGNEVIEVPYSNLIQVINER